jgi:hypothetical protein
MDDDEALLASLLGDDENVENSAKPPAPPPVKRSNHSEASQPAESKVRCSITFVRVSLNLLMLSTWCTADQFTLDQGDRFHRKQKAKLQEGKEWTDSYSTLKIKNRMISKHMMDQHMKGRSAIKLPQLVQSRQSHLEDESVDWVTFGVIVHKSATKSASNGGNYMIWKISDLDNHSISVFLFRDAYNAHWKESEGAVVAVLNASILPAREEFGAFSLSVSEAGEVAKIGTSMDHGTCKATKKDGAPCSMAVNKSKCLYCEYHVGAQLKAINQSSRLELQGTKRGAYKLATRRSCPYVPCTPCFPTSLSRFDSPPLPVSSCSLLLSHQCVVSPRVIRKSAGQSKMHSGLHGGRQQQQQHISQGTYQVGRNGNNRAGHKPGQGQWFSIDKQGRAVKPGLTKGAMLALKGAKSRTQVSRCCCSKHQGAKFLPYPAGCE